MSAPSAPAAAQAAMSEQPPQAELLVPVFAAESEEDTALAGDEVDTELAEETLGPSAAEAQVAEEPTAAIGAPPASDVGEEGVRQAAERVRSAAHLPPGLRERLALAVATDGQMGDGGRALVPIDDALAALAAALPASLMLSPADFQQAEHPGGSAFFQSTAEGELSDAAAEEIARGQLRRTGMLRGQRVHVAQD